MKIKNILNRNYQLGEMVVYEDAVGYETVYGILAKTEFTMPVIGVVQHGVIINFTKSHRGDDDYVAEVLFKEDGIHKITGIGNKSKKFRKANRKEREHSELFPSLEEIAENKKIFGERNF